MLMKEEKCRQDDLMKETCRVIQSCPSNAPGSINNKPLEMHSQVCLLLCRLSGIHPNPTLGGLIQIAPPRHFSYGAQCSVGNKVHPQAPVILALDLNGSRRCLLR